jgi:type I restriction enzyme S subunit
MVIAKNMKSKFQPYAEYKDSGIEWLGQIPVHWYIDRLKWSVKLVTDKFDNSSTDAQYLGLENVESWTGKIIESDFRPETEGISSSFRKGDVLFGKLRPYLAKVVYAQDHGICTSEFMVLRPQKYWARYLFYYMLSPSTVNIIDSSTYGVKMPRANWEFIANLPFVLPPIPEQQAIADFLDQETARIDGLIAKKKRLIELLQEKRTALITHAVTKGLNQNVPMKDSGVEWLGQIPAHWEVKKIKHLARNGYRTFIDGDWIEAPYITTEGIRLIQTGNVGIGEYIEQGFRYVSEDTFRDLHCTEVMPGDILICRLAEPVGRACLAPNLNEKMITSVDVCILKTRESTEARFIVYFLSSSNYLSWLEAICRGGTRSRISRSMLGSIALPFPPIPEQQAIADFLDQETARIDGLISKINQAIEKLQEYRSALITAAVTGKIDVRKEAT